MINYMILITVVGFSSFFIGRWHAIKQVCKLTSVAKDRIRDLKAQFEDEIKNLKKEIEEEEAKK